MAANTWLIRLLVVAGLYAAVAAYAYFCSDSQLFLPAYGSLREPTGLSKIRTESGGGTLAALYLPNPAAQYTVWFFHGNAEDLGDIEPLMREFHRRGFAVFAYDYPGYGLSPGQPSEKAIYAATEAAAKYLREELHVPGQKIIVYGRSLGGGPAVELATRQPVAGLVLQAAFTSVYRVMTRWHLLPFDKFENLRKMAQVRCPVLVMHGRADRTVAFAHGEALYQAAPARKEHFWVEDAGHNDLLQIAGERYWQALQKFAQGLPAQ